MTLDQLAEQTSRRIYNGAIRHSVFGGAYAQGRAVEIIREALEAATQAQRELLEEVRKQRDEARFSPLGDNHHNAAACPYCNPKLEAQREQLEQAQRNAWEAGFALCRSYGDNHIHFDGEQKERYWRAFLERQRACAAPSS